MNIFRAIRKAIYPSPLLMILIMSWTTCQANEVNIQHDGLIVNANLLMAEGKNYQDGVVLVMHGILGHNQMEIVETSQQALLDIGLSSLAINLSLGINNRHGFFDCDVDHRHIQGHALDEIQAWVEYLKSKGSNKIVLLGHSFGANQLMIYARDMLDPAVTHLVFLAPNTTSAFKEGYKRRYGQSVDEALARAKQLIDEGKGDDVMTDTDFLFCPQAQVTPDSFVSYYADESTARYFDFPSFLPGLEIPILVTTGTADERQPRIAEHILPYVDGKTVQLSIIEGAGHFFRDFNIDEAMERVAIFLIDER